MGLRRRGRDWVERVVVVKCSWMGKWSVWVARASGQSGFWNVGGGLASVRGIAMWSMRWWMLVVVENERMGLCGLELAWWG
eukprot:13437350-Alexandrium_andersonii.AAC.1